MNVDWRALEDGMLRRAAKAESFRDLYGGGSAKRGPIVERTGRMTVAQPPFYWEKREQGVSGYSVGDRVRTTVEFTPGWAGAFGAPAGTLGTVTGEEIDGGYGVVLDGDPDEMPLSVHPDEMVKAEEAPL
jgi:hypothetical protein